jgi:hypothetical protein
LDVKIQVPILRPACYAPTSFQMTESALETSLWTAVNRSPTLVFTTYHINPWKPFAKNRTIETQKRPYSANLKWTRCKSWGALPVILSLTTDVRDIQAAQHGDADSGQIEPIQNANIQITSGKLT